MAFTFASNNKNTFTKTGTPYMWSSGDETTVTNGSNIQTLANLTAANFGYGAGSQWRLGTSVAVGPSRIVVGAPLEDSTATDSGTAFVYDINGTPIIQIKASDPGASDRFGSSVAVSSNTIVVGSPFDDDAGANSGSAYIYNTSGNLISKITASDGAAGDVYGSSLSIGSGRLIIGAPGDDSNKGSAYIYTISGNLISKITASDAANNDLYGTSVAAGSGRIVVGAPGDDSNKGSVYIYNTSGNLISKITAFDGAAGDQFGYSVSVGSGRIVVGAYLDDDNGSDSGSAYIYDLNGNFIRKIIGIDTSANDLYGFSVAVGSGRIIVGAPSDRFGTLISGSAYIYDLNGNHLTKIIAWDRDNVINERHGHSVAVGSGRIVVGNSSKAVLDLGVAAGKGYVYSTPNVYTIHDAIELEKGYL
jgi:antitoxin component YwqK of YwqJK toxin-antitoxin module